VGRTTKHIIAKLLRDFELGFMTRRQLIQSLALASTAASAVTANVEAQTTVSAAAHESAFKTVELDHISYQVTDYAKTRDFYADLMGMEVANDNGKSECELRFGNSMVIARNRPQKAPADAPVKSLVDHVAYRIYSWDTDKVREELTRRKLFAAGQKPDTGGGPNYSSFHVKDPDGFNLQISGWAGPQDSVNRKR